MESKLDNIACEIDLRSDVRAFVGRFFNANLIDDEDNMFQRGLVNSLFAMQLVSFVEKKFDVIVEDDEMDIDNFKSISSIINLIQKKI